MRARTPTYLTWIAMRQRCLDPNHSSFRLYGARGISICQAWLGSYSAFLRDMGERPAGKTLDRFPDNDGNYEPDNCRWATKVEQANNRRGNRVISIDGERKTVAQWASASGIPERTLLNRASKGGDEFTAEILDASFRSPKKQFVEHGGSRYSIADLCAITGLSAFGVTDRVRRFNDGQLDFLGLTTRPAKKKAPTRQVATSVV